MLSIDVIIMVGGFIVGSILIFIHVKANWKLITYNNHEEV